MKVVISGKIQSGDEEVTVMVEGEQEAYAGNFVADTYAHAREKILEKKEVKE